MNIKTNINIEEFVVKCIDEELKIICFGIGDMFFNMLKETELCNYITLLVDNKKNGKVHTKTGEIEIVSPELLCNINVSKTVVLITSKFYKEIILQCNSIENLQDVDCYIYNDLCWHDTLLNRSIQRMIKIDEEKGMNYIEAKKRADSYRKQLLKKEDYFIIPKLNFIVTEKCSLKCKDCRALIPFVENPCDVKFEELIEEIDIILNAVDEVVDIEFIGGEPFVFPYLAQAIQYVAENYKVDNVVITTNGTILPDEGLIKALKNKKVFIVISDYGHIDKMAKLIKLFEKEGICFAIETDQIWFDVGNFEKRNRTREELIEEYHNCYCQYLVKYIYDKKIWVCPRAPRLSALKVFESENDYQELSAEDDKNITRKKIYDSFYAQYAEACNYCNQGDLNISLIKAGIQVDGRIAESEYTLIKREDYKELIKVKNGYERYAQ